MFAQEWKYVPLWRQMTLRKVPPSFEEYTGNPRETKKKKRIRISALAKWYDHCLRAKKLQAAETDVGNQLLEQRVISWLQFTPLSNEKPWGQKTWSAIKILLKVVLLFAIWRALQAMRSSCQWYFNPIFSDVFVFLWAVYSLFLYFCRQINFLIGVVFQPVNASQSLVTTLRFLKYYIIIPYSEFPFHNVDEVPLTKLTETVLNQRWRSKQFLSEACVLVKSFNLWPTN